MWYNIDSKQPPCEFDQSMLFHEPSSLAEYGNDYLNMPISKGEWDYLIIYIPESKMD